MFMVCSRLLITANAGQKELVHDSNYGDIALEELQKGVETGRAWTEVRSLTEDLKDQCVLFRGRVNGIRSVGKKMAFLTVRKRVNTVQCVVEAKDGLHNTEMLKYVLGLSKESLVDVEGVVQVPTRAIASATQKVEVKDAGLKVDPLEDLNTESERTLGKLVLEKYGTEFYILYRYPLAVRPFFTMPCHENKLYSNSFDVFMRGEEIISGSQRIHDHMLLESRAKECGVDVKTISQFIDSLRYGAPPRGGFGAGLERVVMLYCGLENIRLASLFPRDPRWLVP